MNDLDLQRSSFNEDDRMFRLAVKRVMVPVLRRIADLIDYGWDPAEAYREVSREIFNEDAV